MRELFDWFLQADKGIAAGTVVIVQLIKLWLPSDPDAPPGAGRFTVAEQFKRYLLALTFVIASGLSVWLDPHEGQSIKGKIGDGLQTAGLAVVMWEIYSNWVRPFVFPKATP